MILNKLVCVHVVNPHLCAGRMTEEEASSMLSNMRLAAPEVDSALVELLSRWALRGLHSSPEPQVTHSLALLPLPVLLLSSLLWLRIWM